MSRIKLSLSVLPGPAFAPTCTSIIVLLYILPSYRERLRHDAAIWQRRALVLVRALKEKAGWEILEPKSCMYLWAKLPPGLIKDDDDLSFCMRLVARTGVALSPGRSFGPGGFGYVRFALVQPEDVLEAAAALIGDTIEEIRRESNHGFTEAEVSTSGVP